MAKPWVALLLENGLHRSREDGVMIAKLQKKLGTGIYTISEAALFARVSPPLLARWLFGNKRGESVVVPQYDPHEKLVGFLDLVQTLAIREIRLQKKIGLQKIKQAVKFAKDHLGMSYPFAMRHVTFLLGDTLVIKRSSDDMDEFIEASGAHRGQKLFNFVEFYLKDLSFDVNGLASRYQIFKSADNVEITMDPRFRFGEPLLPSRYSAMTIWESVLVEGGIEPASKAYGIPKEEVEAAYKFVVNYLGRTAA